MAGEEHGEGLGGQEGRLGSGDVIDELEGGVEMAGAGENVENGGEGGGGRRMIAVAA